MLMGIALMTALSACAAMQQPRQKASEANPVVETATPPNAGVILYSVSPRIEKHPPAGSLPRILLSLGGARSREGEGRMFRAYVEITHDYKGPQHFAFATFGGADRIGTRYLAHDSHCDPSGACQYQETVSVPLPEAEVRSAAQDHRALRFRIHGSEAYVSVAIPASYTSALLAKMDAAPGS